MLEKIKRMKGYQILIKEDLFWQESSMIVNYIKENYEKVGEIYDFQIYLIK